VRRLALLLLLVGLAGCGGAQGAAVRVRVDAGGLTGQIATGAPVERGQVMTVAHVLDGARAVRVDGRAARVLRVDRRRDLAWLAADVDERRFGDGLHVLREGRPVTLRARVLRRVTATIDGRTRPALELDARVEPGDSGAPLTRGGRVIGIVFARGAHSTWAVAL